MILSCDDGCASDLRVANLAAQYNIPCVFYWPVDWHSIAVAKGYKPLGFAEALRLAQHYEIGSHTITHRHLTQLSKNEAFAEIADSKYMLEYIFKKKITKFCPPRGYTDGELTKYTLEIYESQRLTHGGNLVHVHPDSGANDNRPWQIVASEKMGEDFSNDIELWFHSWELDKFNLWEELEGFLRDLSHT